MSDGPIFFDLDDTLLYDTGAKRACLPQLFVAWRDRLHCDEAAFDEAWLAALDHQFEQQRERLRDVFQARLTDEDCDALTREFLRVWEANWRLFDDVIPALDALSHRPLGIITNGLPPYQRDKLTRTGIVDRFTVIITSEASKLSKPDPRIFHHAAAAIGARPEQCVHVGDDWTRDVEGATAAGFRAVWLVRGRGSLDPPRVETIENLMKLVGRV